MSPSGSDTQRDGRDRNREIILAQWGKAKADRDTAKARRTTRETRRHALERNAGYLVPVMDMALLNGRRSRFRAQL